MRPLSLRFEGSSGKATREVEGVDDIHEEEKARIERKIQRAMLEYWRGLQKRVLTQVRKQGKSLGQDITNGP